MSSPQAPGTVPVAPGLPAWDNYSYRAVPVAPLPKPGGSRGKVRAGKGPAWSTTITADDHNRRRPFSANMMAKEPTCRTTGWARSRASATSASAARRAAVRRGADGRGGLRLRRLAAVPRSSADGDRQGRGTAGRDGGRSRRDPGPQSPAPAPPFPHPGTADRGRPGPRTAAADGQRRRPHVYAGTDGPSELYRNSTGDEPSTSLRAGSGSSRSTGRSRPPRGLRRHPRRNDPPVAPAPGQGRGHGHALTIEAGGHIRPPSATCPSTASSWSTRPTASATCAPRESPLIVEGEEVPVLVRTRGGLTRLVYPGTRSTWSAGTAASTLRVQHRPTSSPS